MKLVNYLPYINKQIKYNDEENNDDAHYSDSR